MKRLGIRLLPVAAALLSLLAPTAAAWSAWLHTQTAPAHHHDEAVAGAHDHDAADHDEGHHPDGHRSHVHHPEAWATALLHGHPHDADVPEHEHGVELSGAAPLAPPNSLCTTVDDEPAVASARTASTGGNFPHLSRGIDVLHRNCVLLL